MSTVDEILAAGWYTDRRGRKWRRLPLSGRWADQVIDHQGIHWAGQKIEADQMRLLIERDQHRDACPGLALCRAHPVPFVILWPLATAIPARSTIGKTRNTMGEALEEARRMAVSE